MGRRAKRAREVSAAVEAHGIERVELLSLTIAHGKGDDLKAMRKALAKAWRRILAHRHWRIWRECGSIRAIEVTYGGYAGWHPHLHVLLFVPHALDERERVDLYATLHELWCGAVARELGDEYVPDLEHGVDVRPARRADYITKLGLDGLAAELTDAGLAKRGKRAGHLTPWQIAARAASGNVGYQRLWREYAAAMHGAKQLTWSKGLRKRLGVDNLPSEDVEAPEVVARIGRAEWAAVRDATHEGQPARLAILDCVERGGDADAVRAIVAACVVRERARARANRHELRHQQRQHEVNS